MQPPDFIDGARVLEWAWSDAPFGGVSEPDGSNEINIHGLALCRYDTGSAVYLFACSIEWECEQDAPYDSCVEAKERLPAQYRKEVPLWRANAA